MGQLTRNDVDQLVRLQSENLLSATNDHRLRLGDILVPPIRIPIICRSVESGTVSDETIDVWLVGKEPASDGYRIVMREDGIQFGLASEGFPADRHLVLTGWYGDLPSAFKSM